MFEWTPFVSLSRYLVNLTEYSNHCGHHVSPIFVLLFLLHIELHVFEYLEQLLAAQDGAHSAKIAVPRGAV